VTFSALSAASVTGKLPSILREGQKGGVNAIADAIVRAATPAAQAAKPSPALVGAVKTTRILAQSDGFDKEKIALVIRKVRFVDYSYCLPDNNYVWYGSKPELSPLSVRTDTGAS
jgi:hypothetical protein